MKFTGQVRVPEIDHPGVPATILVEDGQTEVFLDGESLGRWSLYDVQASRLVSSAFSLSLHGEEITFIADEPVDFAYKGVDQMAEAWARYKSMAIPRRVLAVGKSRRGTLPSRISELRTAMLQNLEAADGRTQVLAPIESFREPVPKPTPRPAGIEATMGTPKPVEEKPVGAVPVESAFRPSPVEEVSSSAPVTEPVAPAPPARLRPGPGLLGRSVVPPAEQPSTPEPTATPDPVFASPGHTGPVLRSPWDEPAVPEEPDPIDQLGPLTTEPVVAPAAVPMAPDPGLRESVELEESAQAVEDGDSDEVVPSAPPQMPEMVKELLSTSTDEGGEEGAPDLVVDLGPYEGRSRRDVEPPEPWTSRPSPKEPALAVASIAPDRSGLLGAVRSAFARNKVAHEHQFVEAPGGIGIVRQICAECGYISIGLSD